jgi:phosphoglycolate phosphatase
MSATTPQWDARRFDAVILDLDGTMVDTVGDFVAALQAMLGQLPAPCPQYHVQPAVVELLVGKGSENLIRQILARATAGCDAQLAQALYEPAWAAYQEQYRAINGLHARVYPGVAEGLERFRTMGWSMACVTNKPTEFATELLRRKNLLGYFRCVLGGDALPRKKPDPLPLLHACEVMGSSTQRTLMAGDSSNDAQAARAAGCAVLLVTYGYNHGEPVRAVGADAYTDSLADLPWLD